MKKNPVEKAAKAFRKIINAPDVRRVTHTNGFTHILFKDGQEFVCRGPVVDAVLSGETPPESTENPQKARASAVSLSWTGWENRCGESAFLLRHILYILTKCFLYIRQKRACELSVMLCQGVLCRGQCRAISRA